MKNISTQLAEDNGLIALLEAWQRAPQRLEAVHEAVRWLNSRRLFHASYALSQRALAGSSALSASPACDNNLLLLIQSISAYWAGNYHENWETCQTLLSLLFEHSISAYWVGKYQESWDACQTLLAKQLPPHLEKCVRDNMVLSRQRLDGAAPGTAASTTSALHDEETFQPLLQQGVTRLSHGDGLVMLLTAWQTCPQRWEPVHEAARWLNQRRIYLASYALSKHLLAGSAPPPATSVSAAVFDHLVLFEHSMSAYYVGSYQESWDACQALLSKQLPAHLQECVRRNMTYPRQRLDEEAGAARKRYVPVGPVAPKWTAGEPTYDAMLDSLALERLGRLGGMDRNLEPVEEHEVVKRIGLDGIVTNLSPAERQELRRKLE